MVAQAGADQVVVQPGDGEQRRDRRALGPDGPVGEHEDRRAAGDRGLGLAEDLVQRPLERLAVAAGREGHVEVGHLHVGVLGQPQPVHVLGGQEGLAQLELAHVLRGLVEQVASAAR